MLTDPDVTAGYSVDFTGRFRGAAPAVVRPGTTAEVAAVVGACDRAGAALVPQGGLTGLVGGGVPLGGEVVLSLRRLDGIEEVDPVAGQVSAAAGATIAALHGAAGRAGWAYGVDFAARDAATVGGSVATNAGGVHVLRYGPTRAQVVGIEAVLASGAVVRHMGGLLKDNTGYDLAALFCGSEGTLAVVTAARLRLVPRLEARVVALLAFDWLGEALAAVGALRRSVEALMAVELFFGDGLDLVCEHAGVRPPFATRHDVYVLVEAAAHDDPTAALAAAVDALAGVGDVAVATDAAGRSRLWHYREAHTEAINGLGPPHKLDVTLPASALEAFVAEVPGRVSAAVGPSAQTWLFGHAADGNIHVNVTGIQPSDERVDDAVLAFVAELRGSISAEHGIGVAKRRWLHLNRSPEELAAFRAIKRALDPNDTLNPGVLLPSAPPSR